jgi:hypothetical protein
MIHGMKEIQAGIRRRLLKGFKELNLAHLNFVVHIDPSKNNGKGVTFDPVSIGERIANELS